MKSARYKVSLYCFMSATIFFVLLAIFNISKIDYKYMYMVGLFVDSIAEVYAIKYYLCFSGRRYSRGDAKRLLFLTLNGLAAAIIGYAVCQ